MEGASTPGPLARDQGTEIPNGALSAAGNELCAAVTGYHEALEDLRMRLDQSGVLRPDTPSDTVPGPGLTAAPSLDLSSAVADLIGSQASRIRTATGELRRLTERIDR